MNPNSSATHGIKAPKNKNLLRKAFNLLNNEHRSFRNMILGIIALPIIARISFEISVYQYGIVECLAKPLLAITFGFMELFSVIAAVYFFGLIVVYVVKGSIDFSKSLLEQ